MRLATALGTVSGSTVSASVNGETVTMQVARQIGTIAANDVLVVDQVGALWVVMGILYTTAPAAPDNPAPPPTKPTVTTGKTVFAPVETRTWRASTGWRTETTDMYQGNWANSSWGNNTGVAFYGNSVAQRLGGVTVTSATIRVKRQSSGGITAAQATTLYLVTQKTRPGGSPTLTSSTSGPSLKWGQETTFTIPDSFAQAMVDGTAGGLAIHRASEDPYVIWEGRGNWGPSMTMTINWRR
ncbi:hypothetical protein O7635_05380 [Asanoa sp. WMMD1127]|uniref:hypothetical protein n=1 Tax=Asanoa sp. WMMD1127 TaxID=3016107 RepID=UPI00241608DF|nr:hypothetical protein [Asanoa sp. WMMD1127]MDG4821284.1 hypothetical protein [Asanoa sp. WMMD1127]